MVFVHGTSPGPFRAGRGVRAGRAYNRLLAGNWRLAAIIALVGMAVALPALTPASASAARPNVIMIVTDDQTLGMLNDEVMPNTSRLLVGRGVSFTQAIVSTPQCCPSRAAMLTGQYAHNNRVIANRPGYSLLKRKRQALPSWLRAAGYRTIHIGKFLNGHYPVSGPKPAPGWDRWQTLTASDYRRPVFSIDGRLRNRSSYLTRTLNRMARRSIARYGAGRRPFYLQLDHLAPHVGSGAEGGRCAEGAIPAPRDATSFAGAAAPRNAATAEVDLSDKPEFMQRRLPISAAARARSDRFYGCALGSLQSVDRGVAAIVKALRRKRQLRRTMIVFTSDNGYAFGEHRVQLTKGMPYEEHLRVPLVVRPPRRLRSSGRARRGLELDAPVANIDLAPTVLDIAGARPCVGSQSRCRRMDGRSLLPLLRGRRPSWTRTRAIRTSMNIGARAPILSCAWDGLRTPERSLAEHVSVLEPDGHSCRPASQFELYDLLEDPFQLDGDDPVSPALAQRLDRLRRCSGIRGRDRRLQRRSFCE